MLAIERTPLRFDTAASGVQADNTYRLRLLGAAGVGNIVIYSSTNLADWVQVFTNPPAIGPLEFSDAWSVDLPQRFYRAVEGALERTLRLESLPASSFGNGVFPLRIDGLTAKGPVTIFASPDLTHWEPVFTNPPTIGR